MNERSAAPAVRLERVAKDYLPDWRGYRIRALDDVNLTIGAASICVLAGANGSGKSTLLKICAGLTRVTAGRCEVAGRVGYLPEETLLPDFGSAREFLARLAAIGGADAAAAPAIVARALAASDSDAFADRPLLTLSKGQRQRVGLAQALLREPDVLLLDEPASGLDPRAQQALWELVKRQRAAGRTVLLTAHFLPQLNEVGDRFVVLDRGRVVFDGERAAVASRGGLEQIYLTEVSA